METLNGQTIEDILKSIETMTDEEKEELKNNLRENLMNKNNFIDSMETLNNPTQSITPELTILLSLITIIGLIFVFFGYKLYKSLSERERRREEKRRQKQQKKKK